MDERAEEERDFDDFLRGGKTMKLSLTPQSLKSNEVSASALGTARRVLGGVQAWSWTRVDRCPPNQTDHHFPL